MTIHAVLSGLTHAEKLAAMELLWRDLSRNASRYQSPEWHERVIADRLMHPAPGMPLPVDESLAEVKGRLNARLTRFEARNDFIDALDEHIHEPQHDAWNCNLE